MSGYDIKNNCSNGDDVSIEEVDDFFQICVSASAVPEEDIERAMDSFKVKADWYKHYYSKVLIPCMLMPNYFIENELNKIYDLITGRDNLIADDITDDNGNISEEKLDALIAEIIDIYKYIKDLSCCQCGPELKNKHDEEEFYRCFLYCTLIGVCKIKTTGFVPVKKYSDVIRIAKSSAAYVNKRQVLKTECAALFFDTALANSGQGFFDVMSRSYNIIEGRYIFSLYTDDEWDLVPESLETLKKAERGEYVPGNRMAIILEHTKEAYFRKKNFGNAPEHTIYDLKKSVNDKMEAWSASLNDPDKYIKSYLKAREIYFEYIEKDPTVIEWLTCNIERMIDFFLAEKGRSSILSEFDEELNRENAINIAYLLNQTVRRIEKSKKGGGKA